MVEVMLKLPEKMVAALKAEAKRKGSRRIDTIIREALEKYLESDSKKRENALDRSRRIHEKVKAMIAERYPILKEPRTPEDICQEFDLICEKIRKQLPWKTWEEMERIMRGDNLGLVRYEPVSD
ncbi:MAG: ribbon-helix-helix protein, CopG family [candidate division KSB1 bacterium]|nr:ribbon-helix-helix protein, CopG family [candidate division KSB1 bacterium]